MEKLFREILPMPDISEEWFDIVKETSDTLVIIGKNNRNIEEYTFYKSLENYLKENISLKSIISYFAKSDYDKRSDLCLFSTTIIVEERNIEIDFISRDGKLEAKFEVYGEKPLNSEEKNAIKNVLIYKEKYLKENSKNRLRYLTGELRCIYSYHVQDLLEEP